MDTSRTSSFEKIITLDQAANILSVSVDTLLKWNENNILKPTITYAGEVGYKVEQIKQFLTIKQLAQSKQTHIPNPERLASIEVSGHKPFAVAPFLFITVIMASLTVLLLNRPGNKLQLSESGSAIPALASQTPLPANNSFDPAALNGNIITYAQTANLVSDQDAPDSVFDKNGNIKGKAADADVLAAVTFANGMVQGGSPVKQTLDLNLLPVILALALLSIPFIFKKQLAFTTMNPKGVPEMLPSDSLINPEELRILEVNQKTDGTVVLCFQGQEYKVSKPELDSESDQFIDRLMWLAKPEVKEIDYDASQDADISLSAPLSKLVTRLGFVGLKRDLFFPRTSKNRVLFRRYLTQKDLVSMNLSPDQISREFSNCN